MTAALEGGWVVSSTPRLHFTPGKDTRCPFYRRLGGPHGRSVRAESVVPTGIRSRTVQTVLSRYTDWATRPTVVVVVLVVVVVVVVIITAACEQLAPTEYWKRHDGLAKVINQKLAEAAELIADKSPYYKYTPANVLENENFKLYWIPAYLRTKQYTLIDLT